MPRCSWLRLLDPQVHDLLGDAASSPQTRLQLAKAYNARCRHQEARELLDQILAEDRFNGEAWFERIVAEGDHATAEELENLHRELEGLRDEHPAEGVSRRNLGYVRLLQQRTDDAERALLQAIERNDLDAKTLELMGLLCLQKEHPSEAKTWLLKALSLQPKDPRTLRLLGITCDHLEDAKGAETHFSAAIEVDPNYFWGWHSLGQLLIERGVMADGLRCIHRARSLQVKEPASYFMLAEIFSEQGHLDMAQAELHTLLLLAPSAEVMAEAYSMLGEIRRDLADIEGAVSYFSLATETDPEAANPWSALGDLAREGQRWEDALRCYREALARDPEAADVQVQLGYVLLKVGQPTESEQCFLAALESDPSEYSAYLGLSECYRHLQRNDDQLQMVKEAMALAPEDPDVWNAQGVALEVGEKMVEATDAYEKALSLEPLHRKAANNLGFILERRMTAGETALSDRAVEAWKRRLLICRDEGQSLKMAREHLAKLGVSDETMHHWIEQEGSPCTSKG